MTRTKLPDGARLTDYETPGLYSIANPRDFAPGEYNVEVVRSSNLNGTYFLLYSMQHMPTGQIFEFYIPDH